jgi:hypothetical protein
MDKGRAVRNSYSDSSNIYPFDGSYLASLTTTIVLENNSCNDSKAAKHEIGNAVNM